MSTAEYSWQAAERKIFDYLLGVLGSVEGVEGYMPADYPRLANRSDGVNQWTIRLSGGPNDNANVNTVWHFEGVVEGRFTERALGMRTAGLIMEAIPAGALWKTRFPAHDIDGIHEFSINEKPQLEPSTVEVDTELGDSGGEIRVWELTVPIHAVFGNLDRIE